MSLRRNLSKYLALYSYVEAYRSNKLPEGYTKLSYIQGDGDAYINLGIKLTQNDSVDIALELPSNLNSQNIFGYRSNASTQNIMLFIASTNNNLGVDFNNSNYSTYRLIQQISTNTKYDIIINKDRRAVYQDNTLIGENTVVCSDEILTDNVYLFFGNGSTAYSNAKFTGKIYSVKISDRMDLIPCKDSNNNVGMYDIISGKFFGNVAGVGAFVAGDEIADDYFGFNTVKLKDAIHGKLNELTVYGKTKNKAVDGLDSLIANGGTELIPETYLDTVIAKGKCVQENRLTNGLPSEYQELYYIESTGTQYIDTGIKINSEKVNVKTKVLFPVLENTKTICGSQITTNNGFGGLVFYQTAYGGLGGCFGSSYNNATYQSVSANTVYDIEYDANNGNGSLSINGSTLNTTYTGTLISNNTWYIFWSNGGREEYIIKMRMYGIQLYDDNVLVFNGIPAKRKSDNEVGMYDTVSKTFLTNSGTGVFTASEDKLVDSTSSDYTILDYATFDGTQVIDTGVICNEESRIESKWIANSSSMWVYGTGTTNPRITCYCVSSGNERFGNVTVDNTGITHNVLNTLTQDKNGFYYNGTSGKPYSDVGTFTCLDTLTIGNSNSSTGTPLFAGNFYYMRIYDNGVLIRSYIPVKRNSDNVVGFFDTVSSTFITPFEGNALVAGTVKTTWEPTPNFPVDIWCNNGKIDKSGDVIVLPSDYTQLEYLESTGTQYIDTGIVVDSNTYIKTEFVIKNDISAGGAIFGARPTGSVGGGSQLGHGADAKIVMDWLSGTRFTSSEMFQKDIPYVVEVSNRVFTIKNADTGTIITTNTFSDGVSVDYNFALLGLNNGGTFIPSPDFIQLKSFVIENNNTLVRNMIPAKNSSDVIGVYDTVSGTFFTNAGTGDFVAGPIVDNRNVQEVITAPNGKNLFDKNNIQRIYGYFSTTGGNWAWATNGNSVKIPCKPNTKYTARYDGTSSIIVLGFGSTYTDDQPSPNNVFVPVTNSIRTNNPTKDIPVTITTGANDKWLIVAWPADELYPAQYEEMRQHLIVEEGETPTEYEAGKGFNTAKCKNLLSVGTYQDTQSILDGVINRQLGVFVLDGTEDGWSYNSNQKIFYCNTLKFKKDNNFVSFCTHYKGMDYSQITDLTLDNVVFTSYVSATEGVFAFRDLRFDNTKMTEWKAFLASQYAAGTPVMIIYPLATPITETTSSANLKKKEVSVISGSLSISDLEVTSTESEHTVPTPSQPLSLRCNNGILSTDFKDEYMTLEYAESSGAQYIDLGRVPNNNDIIEQKFQKKGSDTTTCSWYGSMPSSQTILPRIGIGSFKASGTASASIFAGSNYTGMIGAADTNVHTLRFQATSQTELTYTLDGVTDVIDASGSPSSPDFYEPAVELTSYLFARHGSNGVQTYDNEGTRIYYHREYLANGTLVMNLIPVKRKFDNVVGMYDTISQTFFTNQGTGDLIAGPATVNVKGTQETIITVKETNLFDRDTTPIINAYVNANNGTLTAGTPGSSTQYSFVIPCKSNTTYKLDGMTALSGWGSFTDSTIGTIATVFTKGNDTLTTGPNDQYLIGMVYATGTAYDYRDTLNIKEMDVMAYVENLLAIDSTYVDTQNILTGLVTHTIGIKVLDGTENWTVYDSSIPGLVYSDTAITNNLINAPVTSMICSHLQIDKTTTVIVGGIRFQGNVTTNKVTSGRIYIKANDTWSLAQTTQWLADQYAAGTPVIILYPLAITTTESVDAQEMRNSPASIKDASMEGLTLTQTHSIHTTPTPAFPLDLVCNNGVIKGVSKNLFDPAENNITVGYWLRNSDGNPESSPTNYYYNDFMPVKPNTNYIFFGRKKSDGVLSNYNRISWYDSTKTWISNSTYTMGTIGSGTSPANAAFARISCNIDGSTLTADYVLQFNWMFYEGTEEESFVSYGVITEGNPEVLKVKGKNLFDISSVQILPNKAISDTGTYVDNPKVNICDTYIHVKPNTTYTISGNTLSGTVDTGTPVYFRLAYYDSNKTFISRSEGVEGIYYTFTTDSNVNYIKFHYANSTADLNTYVLEEGIRPTRYEEYMDMNYLMPTLLSAGDFADTQELQSGIYNGKIGVKVFDGTENWQNISGYMNISKTDLGSNSTVMPSNSHNIICSHFETKDGTFTDGIGIGGNYVNVKYDSLFTTLAEWQQYLADQYAKGTPVIIVYPLANTSIKTEESKNIYIDAGTNEISRISDIDELEMEVKYKKLK